MEITALGHAGLKFQVAQSTLLIDPWFSPEGAFLASWFQFPENQHLLCPDLLQPTAIIITHEHLDHLDTWFLNQVPTHIPVVIPDYPSPQLQNKILVAGNRPIHIIKAWTPWKIAEQIQVFLVPEESPMNHDAAVVVELGNRVILNLNDARLSTPQLHQICNQLGKPIDVLALQGAGASWFPLCYHYPPEQQQTLSKRKRLVKLNYMMRAIAAVNPVMVLPFAGPPCFLDPELSQFNQEMESGIFPDQQQVVAWLREQGIENALVMLPGDRWNLEHQTQSYDPQWKDFEFGAHRSYLQAYASRRENIIASFKENYPVPQTSLWQNFKAYFEHLLSLSPYFNQQIGMKVGFEIEGPGGGQWAVDFRPSSQGVFQKIEDCAYRYRFSSRWLVPLLEGKLTWEDFFLSLRFSAWRNPDQYNDHLLGLLKFAEPMALQAVEKYETTLSSQEMITVQSGGKTFQVQRYCPHAGQDLLHVGEVLPGDIICCLGHHYEFDLTTGKCLTGNCPSLHVVRTT